MKLSKTNIPGYFVNEQGVVLNDDELAWMKYKAEREKTKTIVELVSMVQELQIKVAELERRIDEAASSD